MNNSRLEPFPKIDHLLFSLDAAPAADQTTTSHMFLKRHLMTTKALRTEWLAGDVCPMTSAKAAAGTSALVTIKGNRRHDYASARGRGTN